MIRILHFFYRYALAVRIMLANLRRRTGMVSGGGMAAPAVPTMSDGVVMPSAAAAEPTFLDSGSGPAPPFTMEELGFAWPYDREMLRPSSIPPWLQEEVRVRFF
jgi:hypothetical protein